MAVSMQTPIPGYGNFGAVASGNIQAERQRQSTELMQLRDLNEKARQFDNQLELNTKQFELHAQNTLENLDAQMDQYWNYQQDMNDLNLKDATQNYFDRRQIDEEQRLLANQFTKNDMSFRGELGRRVDLYRKDLEQTYNEEFDPEGGFFGDILQGVQDFKYDIGMPGLGLSTEEIKQRNLEEVNKKHRENIQELYNEYEIDIPVELSFDPNNPDSATLVNSPGLADLMASEKFAGPELTKRFKDGQLHPGTMAALKTYNNQFLENPLVVTSNLHSLVQQNKPSKSDIFTSYVNAQTMNTMQGNTGPNYVNIPYQSSMPTGGQ